jgi:membrane protein required for colicin V production
MTGIDWGILAVLAISAALSLRRGFVKEALSLVSWIAAFVIARLFSGNLATLLVDYIDTPSARWVVAFICRYRCHRCND